MPEKTSAYRFPTQNLFAFVDSEAGVAPDFVFWRSTSHKLGWYLEPSYDYSSGEDTSSQSE